MFSVAVFQIDEQETRAVIFGAVLRPSSRRMCSGWCFRSWGSLAAVWLCVGGLWLAPGCQGVPNKPGSRRPAPWQVGPGCVRVCARVCACKRMCVFVGCPPHLYRVGDFFPPSLDGEDQAAHPGAPDCQDISGLRFNPNPALPVSKEGREGSWLRRAIPRGPP